MEFDKEIILRQYELMVNSSLQVTNWRQNANGFYLSINTVLISISTYLYNFSPNTGMVTSIIGLAITFLWSRTIQYFRVLNTAKFKVIHKIEEQLPIQMYQLEHDYFIKERMKNATQIEINIPYLFFLAYVIVTLAQIIKIFHLI